MGTEPLYVKEPGDRYAFYRNGKKLFVTKAVAILFDRQTGALLQHGPPASVLAGHRKQSLTYQAKGLSGALKDLTIIHGKFELDDLNKMVSIQGYIGCWYRRMLETAVSEAAKAILQAQQRARQT